MNMLGWQNVIGEVGQARSKRITLILIIKQQHNQIHWTINVVSLRPHDLQITFIQRQTQRP